MKFSQNLLVCKELSRTSFHIYHTTFTFQDGSLLLPSPITRRKG